MHDAGFRRWVPRAAMLLAVVTIGCAPAPAGDEPRDEEEVSADSVTDTGASPELPVDTTALGGADGDGAGSGSDTPGSRWAARLPDGTLTRWGACPFECCVYREWLAESRIPLLTAPGGDPSSASTHLEPGTAFDADSGFVQVETVALVAVTEAVEPMPDRMLQPGDTLVLLDYVGEGFYNVWLDGEVLEVADFWSSATERPRGEVIGERSTAWWVHATAPDGRKGWFRADAAGVELGGVDACG